MLAEPLCPQNAWHNCRSTSSAPRPAAPHPRLEDDDRLDAILAHLRKKTPHAALPGKPGAAEARGAGGGGGSEAQSVKSALAEGLQEVRGRVRELEERLAERRRSASAGRAAQQAAGRGGGKGGGGVKTGGAVRPPGRR